MSLFTTTSGGRALVALFTLFAVSVSSLQAQDIYGYGYRALQEGSHWDRRWREDPLQLGIRFDYFTVAAAQQPLLRGDILLPDLAQHHRPVQQNITREYDATFFYPLKKSGVNLDLGVNIRFLNGHSTNEKGESYRFQQTLPMFYAAMLFDLPFKGLSAGFEGRHMDLDSDLAYEYRAKLRYQWGDSLGIQGGWQHQLLELEQFRNITGEFENEGPYLDVYMNF